MSEEHVENSRGDQSDVTRLEAMRFAELQDAILDPRFPEVDLALRRGRHIHKDDELWYSFLCDAQPLLEAFYQRYGCELTHRTDGYFFLLPLGDGLGKRHLSVAEMIVGQGLALAYLDPRTVQNGGVVTREELLNQLASVMGTDALMRTLNPKRKRPDERVMQRTVRLKVNEALRRLGQLGFVQLLEGEQLRLPPSLMRFAEPVRGLDAPSEALKRLLERGEVSLGPGDAEGEAEVEAEGAQSSDEDELGGDALDDGEERIADDTDLRAYAAGDDDAASDDGFGGDAPLDAPAGEEHRSSLPSAVAHDEIELDWDAIPDEEG